MPIVPLDVNSPEFRHFKREVINNAHLIVEKFIEQGLKDEAIEFNSRLSNPLAKLRKTFDMPSGNVVKIKKK